MRYYRSTLEEAVKIYRENSTCAQSTISPYRLIGHYRVTENIGAASNPRIITNENYEIMLCSFNDMPSHEQIKLAVKKQDEINNTPHGIDTSQPKFTLQRTEIVGSDLLCEFEINQVFKTIRHGFKSIRDQIPFIDGSLDNSGNSIAWAPRTYLTSIAKAYLHHQNNIGI